MSNPWGALTAEVGQWQAQYRVAGEQDSYDNSVMERVVTKGGAWYNCYTAHAACTILFVIRGWNLVYKVETEAAKLKSSHSGLGPGLDVGLARLRQDSLARVGGWGRKENRTWFPLQADRSEGRGGRALSEQSPRGDGRYAAWVVI